MIELEQEDPIPQGDLALQITALPRETNGFGDIFGGWLVAQMDLAGTAMAQPCRRRPRGHRGHRPHGLSGPGRRRRAAIVLYPDPGNRPQLDPDDGRSVERRPAVQRMAQGHRSSLRLRRYRRQWPHPLRTSSLSHAGR
ncbi:thioesterase family protein [Pseudomonas putida S11]|nr:thioesterase family protein [Pseudomonas putida S11]